MFAVELQPLCYLHILSARVCSTTTRGLCSYYRHGKRCNERAVGLAADATLAGILREYVLDRRLAFSKELKEEVKEEVREEWKEEVKGAVQGRIFLGIVNERIYNTL